MLYHDDGFLVYDYDTMLRGSDITLSDLETLESFLTIELRKYGNTKYLIPYIVDFQGTPSVNLRSFYKAGEAIASQRQAVLNIHKSITEDFIDDLIDAQLEIIDRTKNGFVPADIKKYVALDPESQALFKEQSFVTGFKSDTQNTTLRMQRETDKLFIALPTDSEITSYVDSNVAPIVPMDTVWQPYPTPVYRTTEITKILRVPESKRSTEISAAIKTLADSGFEIKGAAKLLSNFPVLPIEHVIGDSINNDLPIQDNEQDYHNALVKFIKHHIHIYNAAVMTSVSPQAILDKDESDYQSGILPPRLEAYLSELLREVARQNYMHCGKWRISQSIFEDDSGDEDTSSRRTDAEDVEGEKFFLGYMIPDFKGSEPDLDIIGFLNLSAEDHSAVVWADAIVKLARWGQRKPTELRVGVDNHNVFHLGAMAMKTAALDLLRMEKIENEDGRYYNMVGWACTTAQDEDGIAVELPSVAIVSLVYRNPSNRMETVRRYYGVSLQDLITDYKSGLPFISGLELDDDGFFATSDNVELAPLLEGSTLQELDYIVGRPEFLKFCVQYEIQNAQTMAQALLAQGGSMLVPEDTTNYLEYLSQQPKALRAATLVGIWNRVLEKTGCPTDKESFVEVLDDYVQNTFDAFEAKLYGKINKTATAPELQASNIFDSLDNDEDEFTGEVDDEGGTELIYQGDLSQLRFSPLHNLKPKAPNDPNSFLIGYICRSGGMVILASANERVTVDPASPIATLQSCARHILGAAVASRVNAQNYVVSQNTLPDIYKMLV